MAESIHRGVGEASSGAEESSGQTGSNVHYGAGSVEWVESGSCQPVRLSQVRYRWMCIDRLVFAGIIE